MDLAFVFRRTEYLGVATGAANGSLIFGAIPFIVGAAIATFHNPADAGIAASIELGAMGAGSIAVSAVLRRLPYRNTALLAALALLAGHILSGVAVIRMNWALFLVARVITGAAEGSLYTVSNAIAAKAPRPDRAFIIIAFAQTLYNALFFTTMAVMNTYYPYDPFRMFMLFSGFSAAAIFLIGFGPSYRAGDDLEDGVPLVKTRLSPMAKRVMAGFVLFSVALYMLFPYVENIGTSNGFSHSQIAVVLAISTVAAMIGPILTAVLTSRFGRMLPLLFAVGFEMGAMLLIVYSHNLYYWGGGQLMAVVLLYMLSPLMFGLAAQVDATGRAAALASVILTLCAAIGPAAAGVILQMTSSYTTVGWINVAAYALMVLLIFRPLRQSDREVSAPVPASHQPSQATV